MSRVQLFLFFFLAALGVFAMRTRADELAATPASSAVVRGEGIPLRPRGAGPDETTPSRTAAPAVGRTLTTVVGALAVCLGVFFLIVWVTKRHPRGGPDSLPKEVVESLGRTPFGNRQQLQLLRVGGKLVLLHVTPTGADALTEITDAAEVDRIVGLCQQSKPTSVTNSFREVLTKYESEPAAKGFLGDLRQSDWELANRVGRNRSTRREELDG